MKIEPLHGWKLTPTEAIALQKQLAGRVDTQTPLGEVELVAGADVSYQRFGTTFYAGVVVLRRDDWSIVETAGAVGENAFPYVPGLLSFREAPILLEVFAKLKHRPDVVMIDGHGFSHPRRCGIASHLGLWLDIPTIGCGKTRLCGEHREPGPRRGSKTMLQYRGETIGSVLRTKDGTKPLYISVGHKIDLPSAVRLVLAACRGYRQPEPTRQAHHVVNEFRRAAKE
jgi:deoxyribonuclease V